MKIINISERKLADLPKIEISNNVLNTEGTLYKYSSKVKWNNNLYALKIYHESSGERFSNKLYTINELINKKDIINIDEIVMPTSLVSVSSEVRGYIMPYIENKNLVDVIKSEEYSKNEIVEYLKQIGIILEKLKVVRKHTEIKNIYLNDLHEGNFIIDENNKVKAIDIDSCKIGINLPACSRYLSPYSEIYDVKKYRKAKKNAAGGIYVVDENTDLYCYSVIILNYLYGDKITKMSLQEYYSYLEYLKIIGIDSNLLGIFYNLYTEVPNKNPLYYLDNLKELEKTKKLDYYSYKR